MLFEKYKEIPTSETLANYPTILDILDSLAEKEQERLRSSQPLQRIQVLKNGHVLGHSIIINGNKRFPYPLLMPCTPSATTYFRGECKYHSSVKPSLMRSKDIERDTLIACVQTCEMELLLNTHPVIRFIQENGVLFKKNTWIKLPVVYEALAQHYGIKTNLLDITNDKWAAAFFATCKYRNGKYTPFYVDENTPENEKYGVLYLLDFPTELYFDYIGELVAPVGMQYFNRPGRQSGLVIDMKDIGDLNNMEYVQKIFFRHDNKCSQLVFSLSQNSRLYMPYDSFGELVQAIVNSKKYSKEAIKLASKRSGIQYTNIVEKLALWGYETSEDLIVQFKKADIEKEWYDWQHGGKERYVSKIVFLPVYR